MKVINVLWFMVVLALYSCMSPNHGISADPIQNALNNTLIKCKDSSYTWQFDANTVTDYVITKIHRSGNAKSYTVDYTVYFNSKKNTSDTSYSLAEGFLKCVFKGSKELNKDVLLYIKPEGFTVHNYNSSQRALSADSFWHDFKLDILSGHRSSVAEKFSYPLKSKLLGEFDNKEELLENYDRIFTNEFITMIQKSMLTNNFKPNMRVNTNNNEFFQISNYENSIYLWDDLMFFTIKSENGKFKIASFSSLSDLNQ